VRLDWAVARAYGAPTIMAKDVPAHITGTVWKIEVKVGQAVAEGDTVVILESMKMEMPVEAPAAGKVKEIRVKEGQAVDEGAVLVVLE
jgi:acetyl-CoA carboxylase biotin carboxyl carrier protein